MNKTTKGRPKVRGDLKALNVKIDANIYTKLDKESLRTYFSNDLKIMA